MGQPGQAGRDGRDGQAPQLTRALKEALRAQRGNLDTTGLENSFDHLGRTLTEVLNVNYQMKFDHMFTSLPIHYGTDPDSFDDWLYQIESLCEIS